AKAGRERRKQAVMCGYMAIFFQHNKLRGLEKSLVDPLARPEFTRHLLDRIADFLYGQHLRMFEACDGLIDVTQVTDDFGTQVGPMISLEVFREFYKPHMRRFVDLAHGFGIKVFHHDDGAIRPFIPDLVEVGIDVLNPLQHNCPGMELEGLKRDFGSELCFHGGVDNQRVLAFGTPEEVREEVRRCIDALACDGTGYVLAPCHNIQALTPVESIVAMYDEAQKYGKF
ncbi:MAG: uroporphyrinogen decarboxylase family protein, partial [Thermoproteota archaeon]